MFRILAALILLATPAAAQDVTAGDLQVGNPVISLPYATARTAAGYMTISNSGEAPDMLIGAKVEGVNAMIHESREENGVSKMVHLDAVEVPAGGGVTFAHGGLHIMLMGLTPGQFKPGDTVMVTLLFDHQGEVPVTFTVQSRSAGGGMGKLTD